MTQQIEFGTRDERPDADEATEGSIAGVVNDLNDQLTVMCGLAHLGGEVSYDAERTESYFAQIESAGTKAAQITRRLLTLDRLAISGTTHTKEVAWPRVQHAIDAPSSPRQAASSFRRRLTAARERRAERQSTE
jgi:hypothetical protein